MRDEPIQENEREMKIIIPLSKGVFQARTAWNLPYAGRKHAPGREYFSGQKKKSQWGNGVITSIMRVLLNRFVITEKMWRSPAGHSVNLLR